MREGRRHILRHDARYQECQPDEAEAVQDEQRPQRLGPFPEAEFRPEVSSGNDPPRDETEGDAYEKPDHLLWHDVSPFFQNSSLWSRLVAMIGALVLPGIAGLAMSAMACSRRHTLESGATCGSDGNGRRSSRSYRLKLNPGLNGTIMNCASSRSQLPNVRWLPGCAA